MSSKSHRYARIFWQLTRRDFRIFKKILPGKLVDTTILILGNLLIFAYIFPMQQNGGETFDFGLFIFAGSLFLYSFFDAIGYTTVAVSDIESNQTILHTLSLPIPSALTFMQMVVSWALRYGLAGLVIIFLGKIVLLESFDMARVNWGKFALIYTVAYLFFGCFFLWLTSVIKKISNLGHLFVRVGNPMFMFGGYFFTWYQADKIAPIFAKLILMNPLLYAFEGARSVIIGPEGFLPYWVCIGMLVFSSVVMGFDGIRRLKRRLDCI